MKVEPTDEGPHIVAEYIYEATGDFINAEEDGMELEAMLEERLEDGIAESEQQPYEIDAAAEELDENDLLVQQASDSDYNPGERCRKPKVRKSRHSKRGRGRPRSSAAGHGNVQEIAPVPLSLKSPPEESSTNIMCEICGNIYSKRAALNIHMRRHLAEKPFECEWVLHHIIYRHHIYGNIYLFQNLQQNLCRPLRAESPHPRAHRREAIHV